MKKQGKLSSGKKAAQKKKQSSLTKQKLVDFLTKTAEVERKLEIVKEMLAQEELFTPASLFYRLDGSRKGHITDRDVERFLRDQKVGFKGSEIKMLFGRIDAAKTEGCVHVREFQNFILPNQDPKLRYFTMRRPVMIPLPHSPLDQKIEWIATKLFSEIITQYSRLMELHQTLLSSFDFDANHIFSLISANGEVITGEDLMRFVAENGREMSKEEVGCLLRVVDKRGEGQLYIDDFRHFFATLGLKKEHEIFDELSPIPALREGQEGRGGRGEGRGGQSREQTLKDRYRDNKSYVQGMDEEGHHILGYSKRRDRSGSPNWLGSSRKAR